jgi:hypothetical protein
MSYSIAMDNEALKKEIKGLLEIVKVCPPALQEKCFELLFNHRFGQVKKMETIEEPGSGSDDKPASSTLPTETAKRIKTFADPHGLSQEAILKVFAVGESGDVSIEVTDLKTKKTSRQQRRLALLVGLRHQLMEGSFDVPTEELREMCVTYSAYDAPNFATNLKNAKAIFAGYKFGGTNKLSPRGKAEAATLIKELTT